MAILYHIVLFMSLLLINNSRCTPNHDFFNARKRQLSQMKIILRPRPKHSEVDARYYRYMPTVTHSYKRILNQPTLCSQHERVFLLYLIRSYYKHYERRHVLRDIFKQPYFANHSIVIEHVFLLGRTNNKTIEKNIRQESDRYKDIIQEDFTESYINVSLKAIMAWKWSVEFCPNVENVFVMNDELFVDQNKLVKYLLENSTGKQISDSFTLCFYKAKGGRDNFAKDRNLDPKYMYKGKFYPKHCHGVGYIAPIKVINKLYLASLNNPSVMPTDVWIGILVEKLNLKLPNHCRLFVIRKIRRYFSSNKYLRLPAFAAITDEEISKDNVAREQRLLFNIVQQHWKSIVIRHRLTTVVSPVKNSKKMLNARKLLLNTIVSTPPDVGKHSYSQISLSQDRFISKNKYTPLILIITLVVLILVFKRKCILKKIILGPPIRLMTTKK